MNGSKGIYKIINVLIRIIIYTVLVFCIYKGAIYAYDFGFSVFTDEPVDEEPGRDISVTILDGYSAYEIGEVLEDNGLISDPKIFWAQELLSEYHGKMEPGIYTLNTSMTIHDMIKAMSPEEETEEE